MCQYQFYSSEKYKRTVKFNLLYVHYSVRWVNLYKKFEIEKYTVSGKLILPKKFGWICEYLQAPCIQNF